MLAARPIDGVWPCGSLEKASAPREAGRLGRQGCWGQEKLGDLGATTGDFFGGCVVISRG